MNTATRIIFLFLLLIPGCSSVFDPIQPEIDGIPTINISMDEDSVFRLIESVAFKQKTACLYEENGEIFDGTINVRGNISRSYGKKSFAVVVKKPEGIIEYAFDASFFDPSTIRNRILFFAYSELGLPAPETTGVALYINGNYIGYYIRIERYRDDELKKFYSAENIELFKCQFRNLGLDIPIQDVSEKKIPDDNDYTALSILLVQLMSLSDTEWDVWSRENFNIEQTARYLAIHNFFGVADTVVKNFFIGRVDGKYVLLPWDNENSLGITTTYYPRLGNNALTSRLLAPNSPFKDEYDRIMSAYFFDSDLFVDGIKNRIDELYTQIDSAVFYDPNRPWSYEEFVEERERIFTFLDFRVAHITGRY